MIIKNMPEAQNLGRKIIYYRLFGTARDPDFKFLATHTISLTGFKNIFN